MKVKFEYQGIVKIAENWLHENINVSLKKTVTQEKFF